jgi:hypothetical protein
MVVQVQHLQLQVHQSLEAVVVQAQQEMRGQLEPLVQVAVAPLDSKVLPQFPLLPQW